MKRLYSASRMIALACAASLVLAGCMINGVKNTNNFAQMPASGTYVLALDAGDEIVGAKIGRMLDFQLKTLGLSPAKNADSADVVVRWAFDVVPAGSTSTAYTSIQPGRSTANIVGNTAYIRSRPGSATTVVDTTDNFQKTIAVRMFDRNGDRLWDGSVTEVGWCNQIFVTAPHIFALMFDGFPAEAINVRQKVGDDPRTEKFKGLFPAGTNWGCR